MKNCILLLLLAILNYNNAFGQGICNPAGDLIIYSNYDGGDFTINIDENIPDIKIGLCSYEDLHVTITGTYAINVTEVLYAGYNNSGTTSVTGVDAGIVNILNYPPATLYDPDGNVNMVCAYECDTTFVPGGCNTVEQATDYFLTELGGGIRYGYFQYSIFSGIYDMSAGGNCCVDAACSFAVDAGQDQAICIGDSVELSGSGALDYSWFPPAGLSDFLIYNPFASPLVTTTYYLTGVDINGCIGIDSLTVTILPQPIPVVTVSDDTLFASGGTSYQWVLNGIIIPGAINDSYVIEESGVYSVIVTSVDGCEQTSADYLLEANNINSAYNNLVVELFPNPAGELLNIYIGKSNEIYQLSIINLAGQKLQYITGESINPIILDISELNEGVYFLEIKNTDICLLKEFIIQH